MKKAVKNHAKIDIGQDRLSSFHFYAELLGDEFHDVGRQDLGVRYQSHFLQPLTVRLTPVHQCLYRYSGTVGQLLFRHSFHNYMVFE